MTHEELLRSVSYSPTSGDFTWIGPRGTKVKKGQKAGGRLSDGYWGVRVLGHLYRAHRLAWFYMTGEWPLHSVDHIDRNPLNNAWDNLRLATQSENAQNIDRKWVKGWERRGSKYRAKIRIKYKVVHLGTYETAEEATAAYLAARSKMHPYSVVRS